MHWVPALPTAERLRVGLGLCCLLMAFIGGSGVEVLPWVLLVVTLDMCAFAILGTESDGSYAREAQGAALLCAAAVAAGVAIVAGPVSLVLLLIPAFQAGERLGNNGTAAIVVFGFFSAFFAAQHDGGLTRDEAAYIGQWTATAMALGILGTWAGSLADRRRQDTEIAAEASALMRRLHHLSDSLDTGFDPPASAEHALSELARTVPTERSAVLLGYGEDPALPVGLRGARRIPWPAPEEPGSLLHRAWAHNESLSTVWWDGATDVAVLAIPLRDNSGTRIGLVVADRPADQPFTREEQGAAEEIAAQHSIFLDAGMVFDSLRVRASLEERERLAREMHDGIAQELAALGFEIDAVRAEARSERSPLQPQLDALRTSLGEALGTLRLQISDLRMAGRVDSSLGAILSSRLQLFGASTGLRTTMEIRETGFRLPAHLEVMLYRLVLDLLSDARRSQGTTAVRVSVQLSSPRALVEVAHDGATQLTDEAFASHPLRQQGGTVDIERRPNGRGAVFRTSVAVVDDARITLRDKRMVNSV